MIDVFIDVETTSSIDLQESGVYAYVEAPDFSILWLSYCVRVDGVKHPVIKVDMTVATEQQIEQIVNILTNTEIRLHAHNAAFERITINKHLGLQVSAERWYCTMTKCLMCGLPGGLDKAAEALGLPYRKLASGTKLINFFSKPIKPTKKNGFRTRNYPEDDLGKWMEYGKYNAQDVEVEMHLDESLDYFIQSKEERQMEILNHKINDYGVMVSEQMCLNAIRLNEAHEEKTMGKLKQLTNLENPNSLPQIKQWLACRDPRLGKVSLSAESQEKLMEVVNDPLIRSVLNLRKQLSNTSISKYYTAIAAKCKDDCLRGMIQYYGAGRTGRFAGRGVQPHNLVKTEIQPLEIAREMLVRGDGERMQLLWDSIPYCLSQLIRTCMIPRPGNTFIISDFSAIEARVLAWLAGEKWRLDVFAKGGKIYEESAARMFKIAVELITKDSPYRARGKVAELALGYQGAVGALIRMGALKMGIKEEELTRIVRDWRNENRRIVKYWYDMENAFVDAMNCGQARVGSIRFLYRKRRMQIILPSGRSLWYHNPRIKDEKLIYDGVDSVRKTWGPIDLYGGKIVENVTQAIARDLLVEAMLRCKHTIVLHVHDEIVFEVPVGLAAQAKVEIHAMMKIKPSWAAWLPLDAATSISPFYRKD